MNCKQFRESLDCYVDGELAAAASAAVDAHRQACPTCNRAVAQVLEMRNAVRQAVRATTPPPDLEARVKVGTTPRWLASIGVARRRGLSRPAVALAALVLGLFVVAAERPPVRVDAANAMDRLGLRLNDSTAVVLEGTVLCRDCELERRYGVKSSCKQIGHHGAIFTDDGRILNLVEQRASARLIHDETLFGKRVIVHGRLFRGARALVIDSYQLEG